MAAITLLHKHDVCSVAIPDLFLVQCRHKTIHAAADTLQMTLPGLNS